MAASISIRKWINWEPELIITNVYTPAVIEPASEPTSTLVLTALSKQFVDVRILKPLNDGEPELPNQGGPMTRLDWAFAGTSTSYPLPPPKIISPNKASHPGIATSSFPTSHSTWTHWIDSLHADVSKVTDQGDMYPSPDGKHVLERGIMINPATGRMARYEEFWEDEEVEIVEGRRCSVVLKMEDEILGEKGEKIVVRGMVVRVGQWCQGLIRVGDEIALERWRYVREAQISGRKNEKVGEGVKDETKNGMWARVARLGRLFLPCTIAFRPEGIVVGSRVSHGDYKWEVNEVCWW